MSSRVVRSFDSADLHDVRASTMSVLMWNCIRRCASDASVSSDTVVIMSDASTR